MALARFLLTRFNAPAKYAPAGLGISDEWLEHRFNLFENFCLPSVLSQTEPGFVWILLIHEQTPERWRSRLMEGLRPLQPAAEVRTVGTSGHEHNILETMERVARDLSADRVVTTRLDNDDAIARDYLSCIAAQARALPREGDYAINYLHGCQVDHAGVFARSMHLNPFVSLVSSAQKPKTVFNRNHLKLGEIATVINLGDEAPNSRKWLQVSHEWNITKLNARSDGFMKKARRWWSKIKRGPARKLDESALDAFALGAEWKSLFAARSD